MFAQWFKQQYPQIRYLSDADRMEVGARCILKKL